MPMIGCVGVDGTDNVQLKTAGVTLALVNLVNYEDLVSSGIYYSLFF